MARGLKLIWMDVGRPGSFTIGRLRSSPTTPSPANDRIPPLTLRYPKFPKPCKRWRKRTRRRERIPPISLYRWVEPFSLPLSSPWDQGFPRYPILFYPIRRPTTPCGFPRRFRGDPEPARRRSPNPPPGGCSRGLRPSPRGRSPRRSCWRSWRRLRGPAPRFLPSQDPFLFS